jgi:hypothetical protein
MCSRYDRLGSQYSSNEDTIPYAYRFRKANENSIWSSSDIASSKPSIGFLDHSNIRPFTTYHSLVLGVFARFSENSISSARPTHQVHPDSPSKLIYSSIGFLDQSIHSHQVHHIHPSLGCSASSSNLCCASVETSGWFQSVCISRPRASCYSAVSCLRTVVQESD